MIELGILKNFDSGTCKAGVQLAGSLTTYFDDISVAKNIPSSALVIGNYVIVAIPGGNPRDACVIATWPGGTPGGGMEVHDNEYHDPDFATEAALAAHAALTTGVHGLFAKSLARAQPTGGQTIPNQTMTVVSLPDEIFDLLNEYNPSNYRFTAQNAGYYLAVGSIRYPASEIVADKSYCAVVRRNGNSNDQVATIQAHAAAAGHTLLIQSIGFTYLNANNYLELCSYHTAGQAVTISTGNLYQTFLAVCRLA